MHKPDHNSCFKIYTEKTINIIKTTEKHLQAKPAAMSTQLRPQRKRALQTAENALHAGFEEWKDSLSEFS